MQPLHVLKPRSYEARGAEHSYKLLIRSHVNMEARRAASVHGASALPPVPRNAAGYPGEC